MTAKKTTAGSSETAAEGSEVASVEPPVPGGEQAAQPSDQPVEVDDEGTIAPSRQMVPPDTESKQEGQFPGDPNWYPDPEDPPKSY